MESRPNGAELELTDTATLPGRTRKPKGEGHSRRAEILAAAERIFVEHGYEGATIRKIADEVGLSSTALYMHFAEKSEILHEICREAFETLQLTSSEAMSRVGPPEQRLRAMIEAYIRFGFENPNAYRLVYMTRPTEARDGANSAAQELGANLFAACEALVEEVSASGKLRAEPRAAAQAIWAAGHGLVSLMITKTYFDWVERERLTRTLLDALFEGLIEP